MSNKRKQPPKFTEDGNVHCPFCQVPHPIYPHRQTECGTILELTAVQSVLSKSQSKLRTCIKCGKSGGTLVKNGEAFVHAKECAPNKVMLTEMPDTSWKAKVAYHMPWLVSKKHGRPAKIDMVDESGQTTGKVAGYYFHKV